MSSKQKMANGIRLIQQEKANTYSGEIEMAGKPVEFDPFAAQPKPVDVDPFAPKKRSWKDVAGEAFTNIPQSAAALATNLYDVVTDPIQAVRGAGELIVGGTQKLMGDPVFQIPALREAEQNVQQRGKAALQAGKEFVGQRYGGEEQLKGTLATDPVGAAADLSLLFTGGAGLASKTPMLSRAAPTLRTAANITDPLYLAGKTAGKTYDLTSGLVKSGLGMKTGVGTEAIEQAVQAGRQGNTTFLENMRGDVPITNVLDDAQANLAQMNLNKQKDYRSGMVDIKNDKSVLDFKGIDQSLQNAQSKVSYKGKIIDKIAVETVEKMRAKIDDWKNSDPAEYHTPEGLDNLKQSLWEDFGKLGKDEKLAYSVGKQIYDSVKNEISKQAPTYAKVMKEYSDASELTKEIERALSLGQTASADTAIRKLQSLMRNNVNTNYGQRLNLAQQLESAGGRDLMPALAGQALSSKLPRGLQSATNIPSAYLAYGAGGPALATLDLLASSPRLVGEASYKYGQLANALTQGQQAASKAIPMTAKQARLAALLGAQSNPYAIGGQK
jgi:hypothetical protein